MNWDHPSERPRPPSASARQRRQFPANARLTRPESYVRRQRVEQTTRARPRDSSVRRRRWWPVLAPLVAAALGVSLALPAGRHQWALSISRQPTRYTALSFNNAAALPTTATPDKPLNVSFSIGNNEGKAVEYRYLVSESPSGKSKTLYSAARAVAAGQTSRVALTVRPTCPSSPCEVEVSLPGYPETIDFFVTLTGQ